MKILVVDDSATMRKIITRSLRKTGYKSAEVAEAADGGEACDMLAGSKFDLILTDVNMPNMSGMELLDHIRKEIEDLKTPVVMITTEATPKAFAEFTAHGASACLAKPFSADELANVLSGVIG